MCLGSVLAVYLFLVFYFLEISLKFFSKMNFRSFFFKEHSIFFGLVLLLLHFDGNANEQIAFNVTSLLLAERVYSNAENKQHILHTERE